MLFREIPAAKDALMASKSADVICSPGTIQGIPGGYAQTYSRHVLPALPARGTDTPSVCSLCHGAKRFCGMDGKAGQSFPSAKERLLSICCKASESAVSVCSESPIPVIARIPIDPQMTSYMDTGKAEYYESVYMDGIKDVLPAIE